MVLIRTVDNVQFNVDRDVAERSVLFKNLLEDIGEKEDEIPVSVNQSVMKRVHWCEYHRNDPIPADEVMQDEARKRTTDISEWDQKFITVDQEMLFEIILAANYLDIKPLLDVGCKTVANMIKGKTPEEIRKLFNIVNDFTPEEEAQIKRENLESESDWRYVSMSHTPRVPNLPGDVVPAQFVADLRRGVAQLCQANIIKFPGSQPVSFAQRDLARLENEEYSDIQPSGNLLLMLVTATGQREPDGLPLDSCPALASSLKIDRHNQYHSLSGFYFPHHDNPRMPLRSTILDGELDTLRLLMFDCLVVDNQNVMSRTLDKRYGRLQEWFYKPYKKMIQDHPHMLQSQPFDIKVKGMNLSYGLEKVFNEDIPKLQHGNDGLIYTCLQSPYVVGTDRNILKWKPPSENTIDFKLVLRFPPDPQRPNEPDFLAKPLFGLHVFVGGRDDYEPFDELYVDDDEWEKLKASGEQIDDRIVEVFWDSSKSQWRMMRFRDDKPSGNHKSVVDNIIQTIIDGVEKEDLLARSNAIRTAWKARQAQQAAPSQHQPSIGPPGPAGRPIHLDSHSSAPVGIDMRYGSLQESPFSRVGGPLTVLGFNR
ncbi:hypothetical protein EW145_g3477 [Phellinidium pouzarii]|uniref:mRNA guanylyltransferase n=1 Tax=Phellinidium pouzarii TaxID=167371 RepID=A0A4S4L6Y2_9AGAM|nr:hypothetical protein EW145_g3477 [Phellinidium pouzarii]